MSFVMKSFVSIKFSLPWFENFDGGNSFIYARKNEVNCDPKSRFSIPANLSKVRKTVFVIKVFIIVYVFSYLDKKHIFVM